MRPRGEGGNFSTFFESPAAPPFPFPAVTRHRQFRQRARPSKVSARTSVSLLSSRPRRPGGVRDGEPQRPRESDRERVREGALELCLVVGAAAIVSQFLVHHRFH